MQEIHGAEYKLPEREEITRRLDSVLEVYKRIERMHREHQWGVVYALKIAREDVRHLEWKRPIVRRVPGGLKFDGGPGVISLAPIPAERIIAKALIPRDWLPSAEFFRDSTKQRLSRSEELSASMFSGE